MSGAMIRRRWRWPARQRVASFLLWLFAFSAWSMTGPAHIALFALTVLFIADWPAARTPLRPDPALWLALGALLLTSLLAWRAALWYPETAAEQWASIWAWCAPFLFIVVAWWLRGDRRLIRQCLLAALLGLLFGVLRKFDWSLLGEILGGVRYDFGRTALGLAFLVSVALLGWLLHPPQRPAGGDRGPIAARQSLVWARAHRFLAWIGWAALALLLSAILMALQARGAVVALVAAGGVLVVYRVLRAGGQGAGSRAGRVARSLLLLLGLLLMAALVLWSGRDRLTGDVAALTAPHASEEVAWQASMGIRANLWRIGLDLFAAHPWLGWGPGTVATESLVPARVIPFSDMTLSYAPEYAHLHAVVLEVMVRFGLVGILIALAWLLVMMRAAHYMWRILAHRDSSLREWLVLAGLMTGLFFLYDFRILHVDLRFFMILYLGILYSFWLNRFRSPEPTAPLDQAAPPAPLNAPDSPGSSRCPAPDVRQTP